MAKRAENNVEELVASRRARFSEAVSKLTARAQSGDLLKLLVLPGAIALVAGFVLMFLGWYGASHTAREIEQLPYLISGGLIGLGLVFIGGLLLATALWTTQLQRFAERMREEDGDSSASEDTAEIGVTRTRDAGPARRRRAPTRRSTRSRP
jgi:NADH:ubiquinone oxidoreductase subunit 6 (subunit J)